MSQRKASLVIFGFTGYAMDCVQVLSPLFTFYRIYTKKSTEQFSILPYISFLLEALLVGWYDLPFVSTRNKPYVYAMDAIFLVIDICYILSFLKFVVHEQKRKIWALIIGDLVIFSFVVAVSCFIVLLPYPARRLRKIRRVFCGSFAAISSIISNMSLYADIRTMIKTKSIKNMSLALIVGCFASALTWFICGCLERDKFVYLPFGVAAVSGVIQLILYIIYCRKDETERPMVYRTIEMFLARDPQRQENPNPPS